jgi:hypothetical protein
MNSTTWRRTTGLSAYLYLGTGILGLLMTSGCEDRVKIKQGDVEISIPRKEYVKSRAFNEKLLHVPPLYMDGTPHPVKLSDIQH